MSVDLRHPRMNTRVLAVFTLVALPLLAVGAVVALGIGQSQLRGSFGLQLSRMAEQTASAIDAYVYRRVLDVSMLGRVPVVRAAAEAGSALPFDGERVLDLDRSWQATGAVPPALASVLSSDAAVFVRDRAAQDVICREIMLTDHQGRLVAASNMTSDYYQADEDWWRDAYGDGVTGRVSVTDVRWDESARTYALEIAVPVPGRSSNDLAGVLKVVTDVREMLALVGGARVGLTGEATLVRPDGSVVLSRHRLEPGSTFFAAPLLRERLQSEPDAVSPFRLWFDASDADGEAQLVGLARSQLDLSYPALTWIVAVSQGEAELFEPVRGQAVNLLMVLGLATVAVLILALWFSMRLAEPPIDIDMKLVERPRVHRIAEEEETTAERA